MFSKLHKILPLALVLSLFISCNEYQKVLKNEDVKAKYDLAEKFYGEKDFKRANRLFEQIAPKYVGKPQGERVLFFLADTYFQIKNYNFAGYQFERFIKSYPKSDKAAEASFLGAKSYYMLSPRYSLDQTDTDKALVKLQNFINTYSESEFLPEANAMAKELTTKKEKKAFEIAKQFTKLGNSYILDYSISAVAALDNFVSDFPGTIFREEAFYLKLVATANLALNSTENRKQERLETAETAYNNLLKYYPETSFQKEADDLYEKINEQLAPFKAQEITSK
ncbi:MAG: outer membrane protein assembly factor BamD [Muriicola sp.]|nr:outer membrane protein assembly factor BamD [Muriicola sp.]NNK10798.1 outer membrane protein assembly factor BamD [Flavobacteriaceae bacterium]